MEEGLTKEEEAALKQVFEAVADDLAEGKSKEKIVKGLVKQDWPEASAVQFVNNVEQEMNRIKESPEGRKMLTQKYARHMGYGLLWAIGGTVVTAVTYSAAASSPSGGTYFVAYGAIIYGVIDFFRGLFGWLKYKE